MHILILWFEKKKKKRKKEEMNIEVWLRKELKRESYVYEDIVCEGTKIISKEFIVIHKNQGAQ